MASNEFMAFPPNAVNRTSWNAEMPTNIMVRPLVEYPVDHILVTNSGYSTCDKREDCIQATRELQARHLQQDLQQDIKQNFLIGGDGLCYVGRGWVMDPWLPDEHIDKLHHMLHISYFGPKGRQPSGIETKALKDLIDLGIEKYFVSPKVIYHYDL
ncbi:peptidoglycan recognition protein 4-like [Macrosteles quadrilineatus]|uniref:peptidoglycan recognition protein 4-like n=1 Tax=Macrosteles quadrilineatus TaxID=74068 RepID=UPI0023E17FED|nr:peptidoglycan recognition protein 4-like [Macrosteles quadrilineatus]